MLTKRQLELLTFIERYVRENRRSPMLSEMRDALGKRSKSGVAFLLSRLEDRGFIRRTRGERNVIVLKPAPRRAALYLLGGDGLMHRKGDIYYNVVDPSAAA